MDGAENHWLHNQDEKFKNFVLAPKMLKNTQNSSMFRHSNNEGAPVTSQVPKSIEPNMIGTLITQ